MLTFDSSHQLQRKYDECIIPFYKSAEFTNK